MDGSGYVGRGDRVIDGVLAASVALAENLAATNAAARQQGAIAVFPMVPAGLIVDLGGSAELPNGYYERAGEPAAIATDRQLCRHYQVREDGMEHPQDLDGL